MKKILIFICPILSCFLIGFIGSKFQEQAVVDWYPTLIKSSLTPPNYAFPIAWSILYFFMGLSISIILCKSTEDEMSLIKTFSLQMLLNLAWSILFFYLQNPILGFIDIILLLVLIIFYAIKAYSVSRISTLLFIPYILWVTFASYLNFYIMIFN